MCVCVCVCVFVCVCVQEFILSCMLVHAVSYAASNGYYQSCVYVCKRCTCAVHVHVYMYACAVHVHVRVCVRVCL